MTDHTRHIGVDATFSPLPAHFAESLQITQAACSLMAADRSLSFEEAVKDVHNVLRYVLNQRHRIQIEDKHA